MPPPVRFAAIGVNHNHIYGQTDCCCARARAGQLLRGGARPGAPSSAEVPTGPAGAGRAEILEDPRLHLVVSAAIPSERGPLGVEAMRHGKDSMSDKPALHDAGAAGRGPPCPGRDRADLLRLLQRALRDARHGPRRRAGRRPARSAGSSRRWGSGRTGCNAPRGPPGSSSARSTAAS